MSRKVVLIKPIRPPLPGISLVIAADFTGKLNITDLVMVSAKKLHPCRKGELLLMVC
jgi:hypothetical protein